ncbi:MAG: hypothetical protein ACRYGF_17270 [Janthinobacterium lividum]
MEQQLRANKPSRPPRPTGLTAIAGFQLLKAAVLLLTGVLLKVEPALVTAPDSLLSSLVYVATRGRFDAINGMLQGGAVLAAMILSIGVYLGVVGMGVLCLNPWARRTLIFNCGMALAFATASVIWPAAVATAAPDTTKLYLLLAPDILIFVYLLQWETAELFSVRRYS